MKPPLLLLLVLAAFLSSGCQVAAEAPAKAELPEQGPARIEFRIGQSEKVDGWKTVVFQGGTIYVSPEAVLSNEDIAFVRPAKDRFGQTSIYLKLNPEGARKLAEVSERHQGKRMVILLDGQLLTAPVIQGPFSDAVVVEGEFDALQVGYRLEKALGKPK